MCRGAGVARRILDVRIAGDEASAQPLETIQGQRRGAGGFFGASELSAHFGLGAAATVDALAVDWPDGARTVLRGVTANRTLTVRP